MPEMSKLLHDIELVEQKDEDSPLSFRIKGGILDGVEYKITISEPKTEEEKPAVEWELTDDTFFIDKCYQMISEIVEEDFNFRLKNAMDDAERKK